MLLVESTLGVFITQNHINAHIEGECGREAAIAYANKNKNGIKA